MALLSPNPSAARHQDLEGRWHAGDSIPVPEVLHRDGDSAWALWTEVSRQHEARFAPTAPLTMPPGMTPEQLAWARTQPAIRGASLRPAARPAQPLFTLETALLVARRNNRVCPRPPQWDALCALLPARRTPRGTQQPPGAATGAAWAVTPSLTKRLCLRAQLEWAERAGALEAVIRFLQAMAEEDWLHMGED